MCHPVHISQLVRGHMRHDTRQHFHVRYHYGISHHREREGCCECSDPSRILAFDSHCQNSGLLKVSSCWPKVETSRLPHFQFPALWLSKIWKVCSSFLKFPRGLSWRPQRIRMSPLWPGMERNGVTVKKFLQLLMVLELCQEQIYFLYMILIIVIITKEPEVPNS